MPPMMPFIHDALWFGFFAGLALFAWKAAERFDLRLASRNLRWPFTAGGGAVAVPANWYRTTTARSSGNSAFDEWRDGELARIEAERSALEARLLAFEDFADKLKRAKDRQTFDRFMTQLRGATTAGADGDEASTPYKPHAD